MSEIPLQAPIKTLLVATGKPKGIPEGGMERTVSNIASKAQEISPELQGLDLAMTTSSEYIATLLKSGAAWKKAFDEVLKEEMKKPDNLGQIDIFEELKPIVEGAVVNEIKSKIESGETESIARGIRECVDLQVLSNLSDPDIKIPSRNDIVQSIRSSQSAVLEGLGVAPDTELWRLSYRGMGENSKGSQQSIDQILGVQSVYTDAVVARYLAGSSISLEAVKQGSDYKRFLKLDEVTDQEKYATRINTVLDSARDSVLKWDEKRYADDLSWPGSKDYDPIAATEDKFVQGLLLGLDRGGSADVALIIDRLSYNPHTAQAAWLGVGVRALADRNFELFEKAATESQMYKKQLISVIGLELGDIPAESEDRTRICEIAVTNFGDEFLDTDLGKSMVNELGGVQAIEDKRSERTIELRRQIVENIERRLSSRYFQDSSRESPVLHQLAESLDGSQRIDKIEVSGDYARQVAFATMVGQEVQVFISQAKSPEDIAVVSARLDALLNAADGLQSNRFGDYPNFNTQLLENLTDTEKSFVSKVSFIRTLMSGKGVNDRTPYTAVKSIKPYFEQSDLLGVQKSELVNLHNGVATVMAETDRLVSQYFGRSYSWSQTPFVDVLRTLPKSLIGGAIADHFEPAVGTYSLGPRQAWGNAEDLSVSSGFWTYKFEQESFRATYLREQAMNFPISRVKGKLEPVFSSAQRIADAHNLLYRKTEFRKGELSTWMTNLKPDSSIYRTDDLDGALLTLPGAIGKRLEEISKKMVEIDEPLESLMRQTSRVSDWRSDQLGKWREAGKALLGFKKDKADASYYGQDKKIIEESLSVFFSPDREAKLRRLLGDKFEQIARPFIGKTPDISSAEFENALKQMEEIANGRPDEFAGNVVEEIAKIGTPESRLANFLASRTTPIDPEHPEKGIKSVKVPRRYNDRSQDITKDSGYSMTDVPLADLTDQDLRMLAQMYISQNDLLRERVKTLTDNAQRQRLPRKVTEALATVKNSFPDWQQDKSLPIFPAIADILSKQTDVQLASIDLEGVLDPKLKDVLEPGQFEEFIEEVSQLREALRKAL